MNVKIPNPNTQLSTTAVIAAIPGGGLIITTPQGQIAVTGQLARKLAVQMTELSHVLTDQAPIRVDNWPARKDAK